MKALLLVLCVLSSGCAVGRFMSIAASHGREPLRTAFVSQRGAPCVLVMLPGIGDPPERFEDSGITGLAAEACDVLIVDAHFGYYRDANVVPRLSEVLEPLRQRYAQIWLVGVSLGGYGAALTAQARPELVDGVVLIAPFLGLERSTRPLVTRVEREGLAAFSTDATRTDPRKHFMEVEPLWNWLAERAKTGEGTEVYLGWGSRDRFAPTLQLIGAAFEGHTYTAEGAHDWDTFARIFGGLVERLPGRAPGKPSSQIVLGG